MSELVTERVTILRYCNRKWSKTHFLSHYESKSTEQNPIVKLDFSTNLNFKKQRSYVKCIAAVKNSENDQFLFSMMKYLSSMYPSVIDFSRLFLSLISCQKTFLNIGSIDHLSSNIQSCISTMKFFSTNRAINRELSKINRSFFHKTSRKYDIYETSV
jgi:hypothetical protein